MPIHLFNSYTRELEEFHPIDPAGRLVKMYTCGPTVYSRAHIGNFRAYIFEDLLQRHLELRGYRVHRVMNITDVDDKTIRGCRAVGIPLAEFTAPFKQAFSDDLEMLRIKRADDFPAATDEKYIAGDDRNDRDPDCARSRLSGRRQIGLFSDQQISRIRTTGAFRSFSNCDRPAGLKSDEYDKEHIGDFALWKAWDEEDGDVGWESPGVAGVPAGISNAAPWRRDSRGAARHPLRRRGQYFPPSRSGDCANGGMHAEKNLSATGCIARICWSTGRRCRSR